MVIAMHPVKLTSTDNAVNADMIAELLKGQGIACYVKDLETGNYMSICMGYSVFGKEIYVDAEDYEKAKQLLAEIASEENTTENVADEEVIDVPFYKKKRFVSYIMILVFVVPILISLGLSLFN